MAIVDNNPPYADTFGCPEFFVTEIFTEVAGGGCVRLIACSKRNGVLIPQYMSVMPYQSMVAGANKALLAALRALHEGGDVVGAVH
jgi:hypothetical protein